MKIILNGRITQTRARTLLDLVSEQRFDPGSLVVEVNHDVVRQEKWKDIRLKDDDSIELLSFVGGG